MEEPIFSEIRLCWYNERIIEKTIKLGNNRFTILFMDLKKNQSPRAFPAGSSSAPGSQNRGIEQPLVTRGMGVCAHPTTVGGSEKKESEVTFRRNLHLFILFYFILFYFILFYFRKTLFLCLVLSLWSLSLIHFAFCNSLSHRPSLWHWGLWSWGWGALRGKSHPHHPFHLGIQPFAAPPVCYY